MPADDFVLQAITAHMQRWKPAGQLIITNRLGTRCNETLSATSVVWQLPVLGPAASRPQIRLGVRSLTAAIGVACRLMCSLPEPGSTTCATSMRRRFQRPARASGCALSVPWGR